MQPIELRQIMQQSTNQLLEMVRTVVWNFISSECRFILSEIKNSEHEQRRVRKRENDKKLPVTLDELMPALQEMHATAYDINLHIYKSTPALTVVDIRYYSKHSLDAEYRKTVVDNSPMIHCKIWTPPWLADKTQRFDVNWEHHEISNWIKLAWIRFKLKLLRWHLA